MAVHSVQRDSACQKANLGWKIQTLKVKNVGAFFVDIATDAIDTCSFQIVRDGRVFCTRRTRCKSTVPKLIRSPTPLFDWGYWNTLSHENFETVQGIVVNRKLSRRFCGEIIFQQQTTVHSHLCGTHEQQLLSLPYLRCQRPHVQ